MSSNAVHLQYLGHDILIVTGLWSAALPQTTVYINTSTGSGSYHIINQRTHWGYVDNPEPLTYWHGLEVARINQLFQTKNPTLLWNFKYALNNCYIKQ